LQIVFSLASGLTLIDYWRRKHDPLRTAHYHIRRYSWVDLPVNLEDGSGYVHFAGLGFVVLGGCGGSGFCLGLACLVSSAALQMKAALWVVLLLAVSGCAARPGSSMGWFQRTNLRENDALALLHHSSASLDADCRRGFAALDRETN